MSCLGVYNQAVVFFILEPSKGFSVRDVFVPVKSTKPTDLEVVYEEGFCSVCRAGSAVDVIPAAQEGFGVMLSL